MNKFYIVIAVLLALSACANEKDDATQPTVNQPLPELVTCPAGQLPDLPGNKCYKNKF